MAYIFPKKKLGRQPCLHLAKMAEKVGRHEEAAYFMFRLVRSTKDICLTHEEFNLLSVSHMNVVESLRAAWRSFSLERGEGTYRALSNIYRAWVRSQLTKQCRNMIKLLEINLWASAKTSELMVVYRRMLGDYHRYLAEIKSGAEREEAIDKALKYYLEAAVIVDENRQHLGPSNPISLGLALNISAFYYEILNEPCEAATIAKQAYEGAADELERTLGKGPYQESGATILMKCLRDNLMTWDSHDADRRPWRPHFFITTERAKGSRIIL